MLKTKRSKTAGAQTLSAALARSRNDDSEREENERRMQAAEYVGILTRETKSDDDLRRVRQLAAALGFTDRDIMEDRDIVAEALRLEENFKTLIDPEDKAARARLEELQGEIEVQEQRLDDLRRESKRIRGQQRQFKQSRREMESLAGRRPLLFDRTGDGPKLLNG